MRQRRAYRWALFFVALFCFFYFVFRDSDSLWALGLFFLSGGLWYWLERRKMRELDGCHRRPSPERPS